MNEEQHAKKREYSETLRKFYEEERLVLSALPDYSAFPEKIAKIKESLLQSSYCFAQSFDEPLVTHRKGIIGKCMVFSKRVIRKCTRFLLRPYAEKAYLFQTKSLETVGYIVDFLGGFGEESSYSKIPIILENIAQSRKTSLDEIEHMMNHMNYMDEQASARYIQVENDIELKLNHLGYVGEQTEARYRQIENDLQLKLNHLDYVGEQTDTRYRQIENDLQLKLNHLDYVGEQTDTRYRQIENDLQLKLNHLDFVENRTNTRYRQISEDIDLRLRMLASMGVLSCDGSSAQSLNSIVSNGKVDIAEVPDFKNKFFWVVNSEANDPISSNARIGKLTIDPELLLGLFSRAGTFLDIGANIGAFSLLFAANAWNGYAFEASSENASALRKSVVINDFDIEIVESAVYDETGNVYFASDGPWGFVQNDIYTDQQYEEIECISVDDWMDTKEDIEKIDFIKIDVEGSEVAVLRGMRRTVEKYNYPLIYIEMNAKTLCLQNETQLSLLVTAANMGYKAYMCRGGVLYYYDAKRFPEEFLTDFVLIKDIPPTLNYSFAENAEPSEEDTVKMIINKLSNHTEWGHLSRSGREQSMEEYNVCLCYALKDYPQYYGHPDIKALLTEIVSDKNNNAFLQKAISWFEGKA